MSSSRTRVALVGADTLLGREIRDVLETGRSKIEIDSYAANAEANFGEEEGESVVRKALTPDLLEHTSVLVLAGSKEGALKALKAAGKRKKRPAVVDCTGTLDQRPEARIYAPALEPGGDGADLLVLAHPAATVLALILSKIAARTPIARAVFEVFEPASERGKPGLAELQQQTASLLSFKTLEKKTFDTQVSFAMLPAYGEEAMVSLGAIEKQIETHLATLLARAVKSGNAVPMPSVRLIQAPVFHGYSLSGWIELESQQNTKDIVEALASDEIDVRTAEHELPTNVGVAGQSGIIAGDIRTDRNNPKAFWLWAVADNLRILADGVNQIVRGLRPPA